MLYNNTGKFFSFFSFYQPNLYFILITVKNLCKKWKLLILDQNVNKTRI